MTGIKQFRILLVDDVPVNIDILASSLSGYKILVAKNGEKALSLVAETNRPDLILLDVEMPGMNGYEVCTRIRSEARYNDIPIIFLTAKTDKKSIVHGFEVGGQDYVTKPFDLSELKARVNTHLELKQNREKLAELNGSLERKVEERTRELTATLVKLETTHKELDTFVYRASHDLKGPTASLLGLVNVGRSDPQVPQTDVLCMIETTLINLNKVLDKLTARHYISQTSAACVRIDFDTMLAEIHKSLNTRAIAYRIIYEPRELTAINFFGDNQLVKIIIENLLENALIFSESSEEVIINLNIEKKSETLQIVVEDTGDGIPADIQEKVFDLFFRGSIRSKGNGLGLYLVKMACDKLRASIQINSVVEHYTRVTVLIPELPKQ